HAGAEGDAQSDAAQARPPQPEGGAVGDREPHDGQAELDDFTCGVGRLHERVGPGVAGHRRAERHEVDVGHRCGEERGERQHPRLALHGSAPISRRTTRDSFSSAAFATATISSWLTGARASGRHMSVTTENPSTRSPLWTPTITSGTVDMPTTSAPRPRRKRYSARVSRFGPVTATKTPRCATMFSSNAARSASFWRPRS